MRYCAFLRAVALGFMLAATVMGQHDHAIAGANVPKDGDLGQISFPTSAPPEAQRHFIRGVLLLHSFEYASARAAFAEARRIAPKFALAYWGEAMTYDHRIWGEHDAPSALAVLKQLAPTPAERRAMAPTEREKMYMDAVEALFDGSNDPLVIAARYSRAMEALAKRFSDDVEARAFYALSLLGLTDTTRNTENYMRAAAVAEEIYQKNPRHPGALHYLIHAYDDPVHAPLGLRAARAYGSVANGASHAQHMPSHIFFALGMWDDAISANIDSMKTARDAGQGGYHPLHWLEHAYLQVGKDADAAKLVATVEEDVRRKNTRNGRSHLAMTRSTYIVETGGTIPDSMLEPVDTTGFASQVEFAGHDLAIGLEYVDRNDLAAARDALTRLRGRIEADRKATGGSAVADRYDATSQGAIAVAQVMEMMLDAAVEFASGGKDRGLQKAVAAGETADKLVFEYGPPMTVKPPWELAGELYLKLDRKKAAADAFERTLKIYPNRRISNAGLRSASK